MKKQLEETISNMHQVLNEINSVGFHFTNFQLYLWPAHDKSFYFQLWDGNNYARNKKGDYSFDISELIEWIEHKKILFMRFGRI